VSRGPRLGLGVLAFAAYVMGLAMAGMTACLAVLIGPFDGFVAVMILVPGVIGLAGGAGIVRAAGPSHRAVALVALVLGGAWVAATVWLIAAYASIGL
jgi:hypothetical protein